MNGQNAHLLLFLFVFVVSTQAQTILRPPKEKPNIVLILADDMGMECLGSYGSAIYETPNLDRLAEKGVRFEHCYSTPLCTPSRVEIMTGLYSFNNYVDFGTLSVNQTTFANLLKDQGYATCIAGKWQLGGDASTIKHFGFDGHCVSHLGGLEPQANSIAKGRFAHPQIQQNGRYLPDDVIRDAYGPDIFANYIIDFIDNNKDKPFFAYYPMVLVHVPFVPTPDSKEWKDPSKRDTKDIRHFKEMVTYADKLVGRIVDSLQRNDLLENTLVVFTGDNGTHGTVSSKMTDNTNIRGGKGTLPDAGTHTPLITYWKGTSAEGLVSHDLVDFTDFLPTFLDASGGNNYPNPPLDGRSFLPQIRGEVGNSREWAFCHYDPNVAFGGFQLNAGRWARDQRFKLYEDGKFFDVSKDRLETNDLQSESLPQDAEQAKAKLSDALQSMPGWVEVGAHHRNSEQNKKYLKKPSENLNQ